MKTEAQIEKALRKLLENSGTVSKYPGMSYEEGIEEALRWVLGEIDDEGFEYADGE